jgi:hypothetical protein
MELLVGVMMMMMMMRVECFFMDIRTAVMEYHIDDFCL